MNNPETLGRPDCQQSTRVSVWRQTLKSNLKFAVIWFGVTIILGWLIASFVSTPGDRITGFGVALVFSLVGCIIIGFRLYCATQPILANKHPASAPAKSTKSIWTPWWYTSPIGILFLWRMFMPYMGDDGNRRGNVATGITVPGVSYPQPNYPYPNQYPIGTRSHFPRVGLPPFDWAKPGLGPVTEVYWKATVVRKMVNDEQFDRWSVDAYTNHQQVGVSEEVNEFNRWSAVLSDISDTSIAGVDPDLVAMVRRHSEQDSNLMGALRELLERVKEKGITEFTPADMKRGVAILNNEIKIPLEMQQVVERCQQAMANRERQLIEIDTMRGKLCERYKSQTFSLPDDPNDGVSR